MYIEFQLPQGLATQPMMYALRGEIRKWAQTYQVPDSAYSQKTIKLTHRLIFNDEQYFSLFGMTWTLTSYQVIQIENEQY